MKFKRHQLITATSGAYDDYKIVGHYRAVRGFDTTVVMEAYLQIHADFSLPYEFDGEHFLGWLVDEGYLDEKNVEEWLIAEYETAIRGDAESADTMSVVDARPDEIRFAAMGEHSATALPGDNSMDVLSKFPWELDEAEPKKITLSERIGNWLISLLMRLGFLRITGDKKDEKETTGRDGLIS